MSDTTTKVTVDADDLAFVLDYLWHGHGEFEHWCESGRPDADHVFVWVRRLATETGMLEEIARDDFEDLNEEVTQ